MMTLLVTGYKSKKELKASIGRELMYRETSMFGSEFKSDGSFVVARRPHLLGGGREFFAQVTMRDGLIERVS